MSFIHKYMYFAINLRFNDNRISGDLHSPVLLEKITFDNLTEMVQIMDQIMQEVNIPKEDAKLTRLDVENRYVKRNIEYVELNQDNFNDYFSRSAPAIRSLSTISKYAIHRYDTINTHD